MHCPTCGSPNPDAQAFCGHCGAAIRAPQSGDDATTGVPARHPDALESGTTFAGRYQIIEELGRGGMGRVYKVIDREVQAKVALKLIRPEIAADQATIDRFRLELTTARGISHKNICRMFDLGRHGGAYFLTMEYVPGQDLKSMVAMSGQLGIGTAISIAKQVCDGLSEAHRLGVVHRDLKPQNIQIDKGGNAHIMDFGIARSVVAKGVTDRGVAIGTPQYMSPEQAEAKDVDARSDIYALGVVIYEMLTGRVPFDADTPLAVAMKQKLEAPKDPREWNAAISPDLAALILKCLEKEKEQRYQSAADVRAELDRIEQGMPTQAKVVPQARPSTSKPITVQFTARQLVVPAVVVLALVLAAVGVWRLRTSKDTAAPPKAGKPVVAVTWFDNQSDRPGLDGTLAEMLRRNLSREAAIEVVSTQKLFDTLAQLGKSDAKTIDRSLATQVALRAGAGTMVTGGIVKLGDHVRITAELLDVASGRILGTMQEDGNRIDDVFTMVDRLTEQVRSKFGLSRATDSSALKIADVSTQSLEAFEHYQKGIEFQLRWNPPAAREELEKAVAADPAFALAWSALSVARNPSLGDRIFGDYEPARQAQAQAKKYVGRVTDRERLNIELRDAQLQYDRKGAAEVARQLIAKFPDDPAGKDAAAYGRKAHDDMAAARALEERFLERNPADANAYNNLAYIQAWMGDHQAAVSTIKRYVALHPEVANSADSAWEIHVQAGLYDEALTYADRYLRLRPELWNGWRLRMQTFLMKDDAEQARRETLTPTDLTPVARVSQAGDVGISYVVQGRFREAGEAFRKAQELADALPAKGGPFYQRHAHFNAGRLLVVEGRTEEAIHEFQEGEAASARGAGGKPDPYAAMSRYLIGAAQAASGDQAGALKRATEIRDLVQKNHFNLPVADLAEFLVAGVEGARGNASAMAAALDRVSDDHAFNSPIYRGLVARRAALVGDNAAALKIYERWRVDEVMSRWDSGQLFVYFYERSRLDYTLGRMYEQMKDTPKAREHYTRFLTLMAKADAGVRDVDEAKKRLAALR
jgi:eukaryotic-like serine/threonine-protein kinase